MIVKIFLVNVGSDETPFSGARVGVALLRHLGQETRLRALAAELGWPVTAYVLPHDGAFLVRYFTPEGEIETADPGALAAAHVLFGLGLTPPDQPVTLLGRGGRRRLAKAPLAFDRLELPLEPSGPVTPPALTEARMAAALGLSPEEVLAGFAAEPGHLLIICRTPAALRRAEGGPGALAALASPTRLTLSAPLEAPEPTGYAVRCFSPAGELPELPERLDFHVGLAPFWAGRLAASRLAIRHQGGRAAHLRAEMADGGRVTLSGRLRFVFRADPSPAPDSRAGDD